jgi:hypothetical protein
MKLLVTSFSSRERFFVWVLLERYVNAQNGREQDQIEDIREALKLDVIDGAVMAARPSILDETDFDALDATPAELDAAELAFLLGLLVRPMPAAVAKHVIKIRRRLGEERDRKGMKSIPAEAGE